jgi:hypothetical protein
LWKGSLKNSDTSRLANSLAMIANGQTRQSIFGNKELAASIRTIAINHTLAAGNRKDTSALAMDGKAREWLYASSHDTPPQNDGMMCSNIKSP